jgi:hypothetical protein
MTGNKTRALLLYATLALCGALLLASAPQVNAQDVSAPAPHSQKIIKVRYEVLHMLYESLQVRSLVDNREIHTFSYSPQIRDRMQQILNAGGYQYGDRVVVWYRRGDDTALKIKGKPSIPK